MATTLPSTPGLVLTVENRIEPVPRVPYIDHAFQVEPNATKVLVRFVFYKAMHGDGQLFLALFDTEDFRGACMKPGMVGEVVLDLWVGLDDATPGAIPGALPEGAWRVMVDVNEITVPLTYRLQVFVDYVIGDRVDDGASAVVPYPADHIVKAEAGWYQGELHAHSTESDGQFPVATVVQAARDVGLDFLSLTDHFTVSQWGKLAPLVNGTTALLRAYEITSHRGHANVQGLHSWIDGYVDRPDWTMNDAADAAHAQGALFCVNHAYSGTLGWRVHEFEWDKADLFEVYHHLEGGNNSWQIALWDSLLARGYRLVGVGGIDSHDPFSGNHALGQARTWVYADELSERGIIAGLRRGQVYVSRGPELRFTARNRDGKVATLWETLPTAGEAVEFEVQVRAEEPLRLFVLRDGLLVNTWVLNRPGDAWQTICFADAPQRKSYYRVELHKILAEDGPYSYIERRDFVTFQALSNPIWVAPNLSGV